MRRRDAQEHVYNRSYQQFWRCYVNAVQARRFPMHLMGKSFAGDVKSPFDVPL